MRTDVRGWRPQSGVVGAHDRRRDGAFVGYPLLGSAPPDTNDADIGDLLVDEVGDADPRRQLILEQLDARHDLAGRPGRSVRHPGEQFFGESGAILRREPVEVRL
jgi:hypothetical protein